MCIPNSPVITGCYRGKWGEVWLNGVFWGRISRKKSGLCAIITSVRQCDLARYCSGVKFRLIWGLCIKGEIYVL